MRIFISSSERLQFSMEKAYTVNILTPDFIQALQTSRRTPAPEVCPE